ncbi:hypothetical protein ACFY7Z_17805 [Streptomyces sp. NPDC012623]|uniref:hypothetical protein n=1 Tax=unclassified Streptomyces TaxID=2593676 RepID=UPI0036CA1140
MPSVTTVGQCLLDYAILSDPFPLYARANDETPPSTLHIVVSNGGGDAVYCQEILFSLPNGDLAQSLVENSVHSIKGEAEDWTVEEIQKGVFIALPAGDYAHFSAQPRSGKERVDRSGITITLRGLRISKMAGTAHVEIRERASTELGTWPVTPGYLPCPVSKFPPPTIPAYTVNNFCAVTSDVAAGEEVILNWSGPKGLGYAVTAGSGAVGKQEGDFQWKGKVYRDTTFKVQYTIAETDYHLTTTVTVKNPQVTGLQVVDVPGGAATVTLDTGVSTSGQVHGGTLRSDGAVTGSSLDVGSGSVRAGAVTAEKLHAGATTITASTITVGEVDTNLVKVTEKGDGGDGSITAKSAQVGTLTIKSP